MSKLPKAAVESVLSRKSVSSPSRSHHSCRCRGPSFVASWLNMELSPRSRHQTTQRPRASPTANYPSRPSILDPPEDCPGNSQGCPAQKAVRNPDGCLNNSEERLGRNSLKNRNLARNGLSESWGSHREARLLPNTSLVTLLGLFSSSGPIVDQGTGCCQSHCMQARVGLLVAATQLPAPVHWPQPAQGGRA